MGKDKPQHKRLELDLVDYKKVLETSGVPLKPVTSAAEAITFIRRVLPDFAKLVGEKISDPETGESFAITFNDQVSIVANILEKSPAARNAFDDFFSQEL